MNERELLTVRAGVGLPLLQAAVTGVLLGFVAWGIGRYFSIENSGSIAVLVGLVVACLAWLISLAVWRRMAGFEEDVQPEIKETFVHVKLASNNSLQFADLPIDEDRLISFARGVLDGKSLTESAWVAGSRLFDSRAEYIQLRDELIARKFGRWKNETCHDRGWVLTPGGMALFRHLTDSPTPEPGKEVFIRPVER